MSESTPSPLPVNPARQQKAQLLAAGARRWLRCYLHDGRKAFGVPSQSTPGLYHLADLRTCTCPDAFRRGRGSPSPQRIRSAR
jgi:hypothetical protein